LPKSSELEHIRDLLTDFSAKEGISPEDALKLSNIRYTVIGRGLFSDLLDLLKSNEDNFPEVFVGLAKYFHKLIFDGIFSNAGSFRKQSDPLDGQVHFGPFDRKSGKTAKFQGTSPQKITSELMTICQWLSSNDSEPILTSIRFYQRFVYIHPFYDANGRIGRLLISLYLGYHGYAVLWKPLETEKKDKFISLLNKCHDLMNKPHFEKKIRQLYRFWEKYVISLQKLEGET